jgi:phage gpG-like protein
MAGEFSVKVEQDGSITTLLLSYSSKAQAIDKFTPIAAKLLHAAVLDVFEAEGPGWAPLTAATLANRRGGAGKILQDTGVMAGTLGELHGADYAEVEAAAAYAIFHVSKLPRKMKADGSPRLPMRDFFNLGPYEEPLLEDIGELIANQVAGA